MRRDTLASSCLRATVCAVDSRVRCVAHCLMVDLSLFACLFFTCDRESIQYVSLQIKVQVVCQVGSIRQWRSGRGTKESTGHLDDPTCRESFTIKQSLTIEFPVLSPCCFALLHCRDYAQVFQRCKLFFCVSVRCETFASRKLDHNSGGGALLPKVRRAHAFSCKHCALTRIGKALLPRGS